MSSSKEKAHDLLYRYLHSGKLHNTKVKYMGAGKTEEHYDENVEIESAKQCALITVDEILSIAGIDCINEQKSYWEEVKEELNKM